MSIEEFLDQYVYASEEKKRVIRAILAYLEGLPSSQESDC